MTQDNSKNSPSEGEPSPATKNEGNAGDVPNELLEALPPDLPEPVRAAIIQQARFSSPLPPPVLYAEYESTCPGAAERLLAMAEKEQRHRHEWEQRALRAYTSDSKLGLSFGLIVAVMMVLGAVVLGYWGNTIVASALVGASALGIVGHFIQGRGGGRDD